MVGFSLGDISGRTIEGAQDRVDRMQKAFDAMIEAFGDMRFEDARDCVEEIGSEIDAVEILLQIHGYETDGQA